MRAAVTAKAMARVLRETQRHLLARALHVLGEERCVEILIETLTIETGGGMLTRAGDRRRTPGGVFLCLCRGRTTAAERRAIFRRARRGVPRLPG